MLDDTPLSPDWWLIREGRRLRDRLTSMDLWWRYYSGDQPLPQGPRKAIQAYLDFQRMCRTNLCAFTVDATVHRTSVIGISDANGEPDEAAWSWWQANRMDSRQRQVYQTALALSVAYVLVSEHPRIDGRPIYTVEHPRQTITEDDPETGETAVGAKFWYDPVLRRGRANVYLPDRTVKYATGVRGPGPLPMLGRSSWERMAGDGVPGGEQAHQLEAVPLVPFACRPFLGETPEADFHRIISIQDRINLGVLNRMTAERYSAFRQKYVTGHKFRKTVDPATGLETVEQPFRPDPGSVWASEGDKVNFGEFSQTDLMGYLKAHEADVRDALILTHTPGYYYATDLINISGDTVSALDVNHIAKVKGLHADWGEGWEEVSRLGGRIAGDSADRDAIEVRWEDPRQLNPTVLADTAVKLQTAGYPLAVIAEKLGESPQRIQAITSAAASQNLLAAAFAAPAPAPAGPPTQGEGQPPAGPPGP